MSKTGLGLSDYQLRINFDLYDTDKDGLVSFVDIQRVYDMCGARFTTEILDLLLYFDKDKDGKLNFKEFKAFMNGN